jgi:hypothetical protein
MYTESDINELEQFFKTTYAPKEIRLSQCEVINDIPSFIKTTYTLAGCTQIQILFLLFMTGSLRSKN